MSRLAWSDMLATGDNAIDTQHKRLIEIINIFLDAMASGQGDQAIQSSLKDLHDYALAHFKDERAFMDRIGFPGREEHCDEHRHLLGLITDYLNQAIADNQPPREIAVFMKNWLVDHILGWDFKYMEHARQVAG